MANKLYISTHQRCCPRNRSAYMVMVEEGYKNESRTVHDHQSGQCGLARDIDCGRTKHV